MDELCVHWQEVAFKLGMPLPKVEAIAMNYPNVRQCMIDVLEWWLIKGDYYSNPYPPEWTQLMALLRDINFPALAERLGNVLYSISSGEVPAPQGFSPSVGEFNVSTHSHFKVVVFTAVQYI